MFDHALVSPQFVPLFGGLVALFVTVLWCEFYYLDTCLRLHCVFLFGRLVAFFVTVLWFGFYYLDTCLRLHLLTRIVTMWLAYGDGSGYAKTTKT